MSESGISCVLLSFLSDKSSSVGHILRFYHYCRTYLALSDISCFLLQFLSDISSPVGHIPSRNRSYMRTLPFIFSVVAMSSRVFCVMISRKRLKIVGDKRHTWCTATVVLECGGVHLTNVCDSSSGQVFVFQMTPIQPLKS